MKKYSWFTLALQFMSSLGRLDTDFLHRNEEVQDLVAKDILGFETRFWICHRLPEWPHWQVTKSELSEHSHQAAAQSSTCLLTAQVQSPATHSTYRSAQVKNTAPAELRSGGST